MKKTFVIALAASLLGNVIFAKTPKPGRYRLLMDRSWKFFLGDDSNAYKTGFDDKLWRLLNLPHDWSIEGELKKSEPTGGGGGYAPTGIGWYRKQFVLPSLVRGKQVSIQFDGVYMNSEVWINGHFLGKRPNGYISFVYDLTPYLAKGENTSEEKILAILGNFEHDGDDLALRNILKGVQAGAAGDFAESRYFEQLRVLAQLRKLDIKFIEVMESITKFFKEEKDPLFRKGEASGEAKGRKEEAITIAGEMKKDGIPAEQIAKFTKLSIEEIGKL